MSSPEVDIDAVRAHWDAYASFFEEFLEPATVLLAQALLAHLRLADARAVLEVGTGPGAAALHAHRALRPDARMVAVDLAPAMVARARARLPESIDVRVADCEELPFEDASFDRLFANLTFMLVPDPDRALAEAYRVLAPGGIAAFSVWGRPEHSHMFSLPMKAAKNADIDIPPSRSNFHLGDRDALRARVARHGFEQVVTWYQAMIPDWRDSARFADMSMKTPRWVANLAGQPEDRIESFRRELVRLADERLAAGEPIGLDALVVVARRP